MKEALAVVFIIFALALGCGPRPSSAGSAQSLVVVPPRASFAESKTTTKSAAVKVFPGKAWEKAARLGGAKQKEVTTEGR